MDESEEENYAGVNARPLGKFPMSALCVIGVDAKEE